MKVCFYLDNSYKANIDYSDPHKGNPGIGGTEYMIWTISYYLHERYSDLEVVLLAPEIKSLPKGMSSLQCRNTMEAVQLSKEINADILVIRGGKYPTTLYEEIDSLKLKTVLWSHNFETSESLKPAIKCQFIKRNVCVSKEQYDRLRDHKVFEKSTYIFNGFDFDIYNQLSLESKDKKENIVCYVGAINRIKGFEIIAKAWVKIEEKVPDAKLYIIGGGSLYNDKSNLGSFGIAKADYEKEFIHYLINSKGELKSSVKFFGVLGKEDKIKVMLQAKVGIANIAKDETFCLTAVEYQALGIPVVAKKSYGLLDTVKDMETGFLINSENQFSNSVVRLLRNEQERSMLGKNGFHFVREKFKLHDICERWHELFYDIINERETSAELNVNSYINNLKWLREMNRRIKYNTFLNNLPAILEYPNCIYDSKLYQQLHSTKRNFKRNENV